MLRRPRVVLLDEATASLDVAAEEALYARLRAAVPVVVSVAHRPTVAPFHTKVLEWREGGVWELRELIEGK